MHHWRARLVSVHVAEQELPCAVCLFLGLLAFEVAQRHSRNRDSKLLFTVRTSVTVSAGSFGVAGVLLWLLCVSRRSWCGRCRASFPARARGRRRIRAYLRGRRGLRFPPRGSSSGWVFVGGVSSGHGLSLVLSGVSSFWRGAVCSPEVCRSGVEGAAAGFVRSLAESSWHCGRSQQKRRRGLVQKKFRGRAIWWFGRPAVGPFPPSRDHLEALKTDADGLSDPVLDVVHDFVRQVGFVRT